MHETEADLEQLQDLLDRSHAGAGEHLKRIFSEERRVPAAELPQLLPEVQVLHLATVTAAGEPRVAPVDGLFFRGHFWFGSAPDSLRFRNIRAGRSRVSATVTHGEEFAVVLHGAAVEVDMTAPEQDPFKDYCREVYGAREDSWDGWAKGAPYARIEPERMFTFRMQAGQ